MSGMEIVDQETGRKIPIPENWAVAPTSFDQAYLEITDKRSVQDPQVTAKEVDILVGALGLNPRNKILDLCGGQGRHALELASRGFSQVAVLDASRYLLEQGKKLSQQKGLGVEFIFGDARCTNLPLHYYDLVMVLGSSLGYSGSSGDSTILLEIFRILAPGGRCVLDLPDKEATIQAVLEAAGRINYFNVTHREVDYLVTRQKALSACGSRVLSLEKVKHPEIGVVKELAYAVRLYSAEDIRFLLEQAGFVSIELRPFTDRADGQDCGFMNNRVMVIASRPGHIN